MPRRRCRWAVTPNTSLLYGSRGAPCARRAVVQSVFFIVLAMTSGVRQSPLEGGGAEGGGGCNPRLLLLLPRTQAVPPLPRSQVVLGNAMIREAVLRRRGARCRRRRAVTQTKRKCDFRDQRVAKCNFVTRRREGLLAVIVCFRRLGRRTDEMPASAGVGDRYPAARPRSYHPEKGPRLFPSRRRRHAITPRRALRTRSVTASPTGVPGASGSIGEPVVGS
jgi:hypothetical protein